MKKQSELNRALFPSVEQMPWDAAHTDVRQIASLLSQGADPNARQADGTTVLMAAANNENPLVVALLLRHGAKVNATNQQGWTALH